MLCRSVIIQRCWPAPVTQPFDASKLTSVSLLDRLKSAEPDDPQWRRLHDIYEPWILRWLARVPELRDEAHDVTQEVLMVVVRELPSFQRQRDGSFRRWLSNVLLNRLRSHWKQRRRRALVGVDSDSVDGFLQQLEDPVIFRPLQYQSRVPSREPLRKERRSPLASLPVTVAERLRSLYSGVHHASRRCVGGRCPPYD